MPSPTALAGGCSGAVPAVAVHGRPKYLESQSDAFWNAPSRPHKAEGSEGLWLAEFMRLFYHACCTRQPPARELVKHSDIVLIFVDSFPSPLHMSCENISVHNRTSSLSAIRKVLGPRRCGIVWERPASDLNHEHCLCSVSKLAYVNNTTFAWPRRGNDSQPRWSILRT